MLSPAPSAIKERPATGGSHLSLETVTKRFGEVTAVDAVSLQLRQGEFVTLLGDSGCGKTTLLRIVAGFVTPDGGRVWQGSRDVTHLAPAARRMGFVFQSYALFPTKTAAQNIGFALAMARRPRNVIRERVAALAAIVEIDGLLDRYPHELSGGQQQRVALARALAAEPEILLLDEPMSALDARIRAKLRAELRSLVDRLGMTTLYVTHDQEEALAISDRVAVMRHGRIKQIGTPGEIYHRPRSDFVANFIGVSNLFEGVARSGGLEVGGELWPASLPTATPAGSPVSAMIRPEHVVPVAAGGTGTFTGRIEAIAFLGATVRLTVQLASGGRLVCEQPSTSHWARLSRGAPIALRPDFSQLVILERDAAQ